jgi:OmpA-OmpF porin, OOP family
LILILAVGLLVGKLIAQEENKIESKYDFIPGEKVIFFDDFTSVNVGDFPAQWNTNGSGEIVTSSKYPGNWFQITKQGYYIPDLSNDLTDNFTIEFDLAPMHVDKSASSIGMYFYILKSDRNKPGYSALPGDAGLRLQPDYEIIFWSNWMENLEWENQGKVDFTFKMGQKYHVAFWIQKLPVRMYIDESKIMDLPRGLKPKYQYNIFRMETLEDAKPLIGNFRVAAGLPDMRNKLLKDGKFISYGVLFDVNSDKVKPESNATLKELAAIIKDNPNLKIKIVGHTDSDGDETANLDLSKRRSASVKSELSSKFGVDASRLETDGKGESSPLAPNDSGVNKALNRRVEFIKQ